MKNKTIRDIVPSSDFRALSCRIAAHDKWAQTEDRTAATANARQAFRDSFAKKIDPTGTMDPAERAVRAEHLRKAFYARLALKSAQARRARSNAAKLELEVQTAAEEAGATAEVLAELGIARDLSADEVGSDAA